MPKMQCDFVLALNIIVSIFGLLIMLLFAFNPPLINESFLLRKFLIGSVFSFICIFGAFAALFPSLCSKVFCFQTDGVKDASHRTKSASHHPDCREFSTHVIHMNDRTLCAACTGLLLGALIALIGTILCFFSGLCIEKVSFAAVLIGVAGIILGFLQFKFRGFIRLTLNVFFVLGAFLILVGIDELTKSLPIDLFLAALVVFWIVTRIQISQWDHWRICSNCESPCEATAIRKKWV
jgi:hypothetical protein